MGGNSQANDDKRTIAILTSRIKELEKELEDSRSQMTNYQEDLKDQTWFLKNIFDNIPVAISIFDKEAKLVSFNNKFSDMFGIIDEKEVLSKSFFKNQISKQRMHQVESIDKTEHHINFDLNHAHYHSSRTGVINLSQKVIKLYDPEGNHYGYVNMSIEDTDRLLAISKVNDFENFFAIISDFAKIGYTKVNLVDNTGYAIKQWYKNLGEEETTPFSEIFGKHKNVHPADRKSLIENLTLLKEGKMKSYQAEVRIKRSAPQTGWNWIRKFGIITEYAPGKGIIELISVNYDITELKESALALQKARDRAERADHLKNAFLANMSHEIRTPLNAIVGFSTLLCDDEYEKDKNKFRNIIQSNSKVLLQLISDILDLSKMESGLQEFTFKMTDVNSLCKNLVTSLEKHTGENVQLLFDQHQEHCDIFCDETRLQQLLTNFLTNAIKHTETGSVKLGYVVKDGNISFYVKDTGTGIPKGQLRKIFGRFVKLDEFVPGTGLGLSICKNIAKRLDGKITVSSKEGQGSTFKFTMPCQTGTIKTES